MPDRPLFVTRKFPPSVGGMETLAAGVWRTLSASRPDAVLLAHGGSNRGLPRWLPAALLRVARLTSTRRVGFVLTGDALMYAVLAPLLRVLRTPHATMVMGLDVTYDSRLYRALVHPWLRRCPRVIAISEATAAAVRDVGVDADRVSVVRLGVAAPHLTAVQRAEMRADLVRTVGIPDDAVVLLTLGRLVRRKGARWFVQHVLPSLSREVHYVVAGDGPERTPLEDAVTAAGLGDRVHVLGAVDDATRETLMAGADVFVQPNIPVDGDMEGFGLVTIEAGLRGTPVVAADLEGIKDAVTDGETGVLLPPEDADSWVRRLTELTADRTGLALLGERFAAAARSRYGEEQMGRELAATLGLVTRAVR